MEGRIEEFDFGLAQIFQLLRENKTGVLTLNNDNNEYATINFHKGKISRVSKNGKELSVLLKEYLIDTEQLSDKQLEQISAMGSGSNAKFDFLLLKAGFFTPEKIKEMLEFVMYETILDLFKWNRGKYKFDITPEAHLGQMDILISPDELGMEGAVRADEWGRFSLKFDSPLIVVNVRKDAKSNTRELSPDERKMLNLIDGKKNIAELIRCGKIMEYRTYKALFDLSQKGLIDIVSKPDTKETKITPPIEVKEKPKQLAVILVSSILLILLVAISLLLRDFIIEVVSERKSLRESAINKITRQQELKNIDLALRVYFVSYGVYPNTLEELVNIGILNNEQITDAKGSIYEYKISNNRMSYKLAE